MPFQHGLRENLDLLLLACISEIFWFFSRSREWNAASFSRPKELLFFHKINPANNDYIIGKSIACRIKCWNTLQRFGIIHANR